MCKGVKSLLIGIFTKLRNFNIAPNIDLLHLLNDLFTPNFLDPASQTGGNNDKYYEMK